MNPYSITRTSPVSGIQHTQMLLMTPEQYKEIQPYLIDERPARLIQQIVPHLSPEEREFILTGITAQEWQQLFSDEERQ